MMNRKMIARRLVKIAKLILSAQGKYVAVNDLPDGIKMALKKMRFGRRDIQVVPTSSFSVATSFEGNRAVAVTVDIRSGRVTESQQGSWGGPNPYEDKPIDRPAKINVPNKSVIIAGEMGGRGKFLRIYVNPSDLDEVILADEEDEQILTDDEIKALNIIGGIKGGYRASEFERYGLGPYSKTNPTIKSLSDKGMIKFMGAGIRITTLGRNLRR